jgi:hypothetical protein
MNKWVQEYQCCGCVLDQTRKCFKQGEQDLKNLACQNHVVGTICKTFYSLYK